ncbi:MAG: hypothetical protein HKO57_04055 [Akkermansiaceae bacterium]|nr:hypothetical protein [Akkermansiaceae bacterium]
MSCRDDDTTPDWDGTAAGAAAEAVPGESPAAPAPAEPESASLPGPAAPAPEGEDAPAANSLRFLSYNLENYLTMTRYQNSKRIDTPKPEREKEAVVALIVATNPDVLGVCEIGTRADLADLQQRLAEAGLDLPHTEHAGGADETRKLGLLSRFPITARNSQRDLTYNLQGQITPIRRGILDATVDAHGKAIRFLGVHLKSKREIAEADQELIRRNEAYLLRKHADAILAEDPDALLCAYGDFNDTRRTTTVRSIKGPYGSERFLEDLPIRDSSGLLWTHYWDYQHIYSRFDFVLVSPALKPLAQLKKSYIVDDPSWKTASDHRAILAVFEW